MESLQSIIQDYVSGKVQTGSRQGLIQKRKLWTGLFLAAHADIGYTKTVFINDMG